MNHAVRHFINLLIQTVLTGVECIHKNKYLQDFSPISNYPGK